MTKFIVYKKPLKTKSFFINLKQLEQKQYFQEIKKIYCKKKNNKSFSYLIEILQICVKKERNVFTSHI